MSSEKSKPGSYYSKYFDERQLIERYRISFETMILTFILIYISGMVKIFHGPWAANNVEMMVLLVLPLTWFLVRSIMKGAYLSVQIRNYVWPAILFALIGLVNIIPAVYQIINGGAVIENGMLSEDLFQFFLGFPFLLVSAAYLIKRKTDMNDEESH